MLRARIRALIRVVSFPARADREPDDELRFHLAEEARDHMERGQSEADATRAARRARGNLARVKEETRAVWVSTRLEQLFQDLRFGLRILTKSSAVSATAIVLIALVIGGNTTVFSIAHGILRKPAPGVHADDLATVSWVTADGNVQSAVGKILIAGAADRPLRAEVVGVVGNAYFGGRGSATHPRYVFFSNHEQPRSPGETTFLIRHNAPEETVARGVAKALREADPLVALASLRSLDDHLAGEIAPLWMLTRLLLFFAGASLLIAGIGQYAVVSFEGRRRTREFGLRIALGASPEQLIASVLSEGVRWTAAGLVFGFALSVGVAILLTRVLFGVTPTDPPTYVSVFAWLSGVSLAACYLPARRAARADPVIALRTE